ncbi:f-box domain protein [Colletotrichum incanum]|uniref:F-box domain protein n=1 Tax=Colletotrichum incanum TaxID=1573173 RepID=A0A167DJU9_COLIC|nr:f-box domain protein [Colletotrichum incanum]
MAVGSNSPNYRCAICGGPFGTFTIAHHSRSQDEKDPERLEGVWTTDGDYWGLDPYYYDEADVAWLNKARVLGLNSTAEFDTTRAFISGVGSIEPTHGYFEITPANRGDDPNVPGQNLRRFSCYFDETEIEPVFPFHPCCYELLLLNLFEEHNIQATHLDKDILYNVMFELATEPSSLYLRLDYGVEMSSTFKPKPGRDPITVIPLISDGASGTLYDLSGYAAMRPFDLEEYSSVLSVIPPATSDPFAKLPLEVLALMASFLDTKSIFQLIRTSRMMFLAVVQNRIFWKRHLQVWYRWYFEWQKILLEDTDPYLQKADLMQIAFKIDRPERSDAISGIIMTNRRRIWGVCDQLTQRYAARHRLQHGD